MNLWLLLTLAAMASALYAVALSTPFGVRLTLAKTHYTVILGVAMIIGFVAMVDIEAAWLTLAFAVAMGVPMIVRSELRDLQARHALEQKMQGEE